MANRQGQYTGMVGSIHQPVTGKAREMGIGSTRTISLADARERAAVARKMIADGLDPIEVRQQERAAQKKETGLTFEQVALCYIKEQAPGWKDRRGRQSGKAPSGSTFSQCSVASRSAAWIQMMC